MLNKKMSNDMHDGKPQYEVADILTHYLDDYLEKYGINNDQRQAIEAILQCRTFEMGYHKTKCDECDYEQIEYNSCRNRHCPKCQGS